MKSLNILSTVFLYIIAMPFCSAQIIDIDEPLQKNINLLMDRAEFLKTDAINKGNYVASQKLNMIILFLDDIKLSFQKDINKSLKKLDQTLTSSLNEVQNILNSSWHELGELEENLDLIIQSSLQDLCNKFTILCNNNSQKSISYVKGQIITYDPIDDYEIVFKGPILNDIAISTELSIYSEDGKINSVQLPISNVNERKFRIDKSTLNALFIDTSCRSLNYKLFISKRMKKKSFLIFNKHFIKHDSIVNTIMLLPKYPIKYQLYSLATAYDTLRGEDYSKSTYLSIPIPKRPGPRKHSYSDVPNEITLLNDEIFMGFKLKSFHSEHYYYTGQVFLQDHWDTHYLGQLSYEYRIGNSGRTVSYNIKNSLYSEPVHEVHIGERRPFFNSVFNCLGCNELSAEAIVYYGKLKERIDIQSLQINNSDTDKLNYGIHNSKLLPKNFVDFKLFIQPYYWNNDKTEKILTLDNRTFSSEYLNVSVKPIADQLEININ